MVPSVDAVAAVHTAVHVLCQRAWSWESCSLPALRLGVMGQRLQPSAVRVLRISDRVLKFRRKVLIITMFFLAVKKSGSMNDSEGVLLAFAP